METIGLLLLKPGEILRIFVVAVVNLDADSATCSDTGSVDVKHVGVGLGYCFLDKVAVSYVNLLFQPL